MMKTTLLIICVAFAIIPAAVAVSSATEVGRIHFWNQRYYLAFGAWGQSTSLTIGYITHTDEFRIANDFHSEDDAMLLSSGEYFGGDTNSLGFGFASDPHGYGWLHIFVAVPHLLVTGFWLFVSYVLISRLRIKLSISHLLAVTALSAIAIVIFQRFNPMPFVVASSTATIITAIILICIATFSLGKKTLRKNVG